MVEDGMVEENVIDPMDLVKDLANQIGFQQLYDIVTIMKGDPEIDPKNQEIEEIKAHIRYLQDQMSRDSGMIEGLKYAIRYHKVGGDDL